MSRVYAHDENNRRRLVRIECDAYPCDAAARPGPEIEGWTLTGWRELDGTRYELNWCPSCTAKRETKL
jgi:hypothetical protein